LVSNLLKSETEGVKNKGRKAQGCTGYLTPKKKKKTKTKNTPKNKTSLKHN
jgi:hypothetical protein